MSVSMNGSTRVSSSGSTRLAASETQQDSPALSQQPGSRLEAAILRTLAYGDVFDYPMTVAEICRYLEGARARAHTIESYLGRGKLLSKHTCVEGQYVCLRGRQALFETRRQREAQAQRVWPKALRYGKLIAGLPFVRMVAVTGSLAVNNLGESGDIDYLVVTVPGRVWLCRALTIAVVRWAALHGDLICPNYVLSERALQSDRQDLYNARELAQMVPLSGLETYSRMRRANRWTDRLLPNAGGCPPKTPTPSMPAPRGGLKSATESLLSTRVGDAFEAWEMRRKVSRLASQVNGNREADFCAEWCKGHFEGYAGRVMAAYRSRLAELGLRELPDSLSPSIPVWSLEG
jgi:hypothetical protein